MNLLKKLVYQSNILLVTLIMFYSCSTNQKNTSTPRFEEYGRVTEILSNDRRFSLSDSIKQYKKISSRAEDFFDYVVKNPRTIGRISFDYTIDTRDILLVKVEQSEGLIISQVDSYSPIWRFSDVIAYHQNGVIYFNKYKMKRDDCDVIATFVHEYMHRLGYTHGDNNPKNKAHSVPYYMGSLAKEICLKDKI